MDLSQKNTNQTKSQASKAYSKNQKKNKKDTSAKKLPTTKDIQDKITEFNLKLDAACVYYSSELTKIKKMSFNIFYKQQLSKQNKVKKFVFNLSFYAIIT